MSAVEFESVTRICGAARAVDRVSARFERGKIHAILGENGAGKTSLMKLLFGLVRLDEGSIRIDGEVKHWQSPGDAIRAGLGMVQQHFTLVESLSVIDNIMLGAESVSFGGVLDRAHAIEDLEAKLPSKTLRLDWHRIVSELSVGQKQKVEILKLIARDAKILVLDEPTAVLSPLEIEELFSVLKGFRDQGRTVFVITHKLREVFEHCDTWFVLRAGKRIAAGSVRETKVEDVVEAMVGTGMKALSERRPAKLGSEELQFKDVSILEGAHPVQDLSFEVRSGEVLGIAGVDGSGQSEIVQALLGLKPFRGRIEALGTEMTSNRGLSQRTARSLRRLREKGLALISEDRHHEGLWMDESVIVNAGIGFEDRNGFSRNGWIDSRKWTDTVTAWLRDFDVRFNSAEMAIRGLSGGNQQKAIFARELSGRKNRLIVAHQPTRGVDFAAIRLIHERILSARDAGSAVLVISSELDELFELSDRILVLCGGRKTGLFHRTTDGFSREAIGAAMTDTGRRADTRISS